MFKFAFIYQTENDNDDGYRVIDADNMESAKAEMKAQIMAEGTHGKSYRVGAIQQIAA